MKNFGQKLGFISLLCLGSIIISAIALNIVLKSNANYQKELQEADKYIEDFSQRGYMVASGEGGLSITPVDAYIIDGVIYVKGTLKNETGLNLKLKNFGRVSGDFTNSNFKTNLDDDTILKNKDELDITFSIGAYDIMQTKNDFPQNIIFKLESYNNANDNYLEYELNFSISWLYNAPIN